MTSNEIAKALARAVELAQVAGQLAAILGAPGASKVGAYLTALADLTDTILDAVDNGGVVLEATDLVTVRNMQALIQAQNDALAAEVAAS
jgi:hypothetical protein